MAAAGDRPTGRRRRAGGRRGAAYPDQRTVTADPGGVAGSAPGTGRGRSRYRPTLAARRARGSRRGGPRVRRPRHPAGSDTRPRMVGRRGPVGRPPEPARTLRTSGPVTAAGGATGEDSGAGTPRTGGADGTDAARLLVEAAPGAQVAHLVCHVDVDFDDPMASVLRLASGVRLGELFERRLAGEAHLVLSGCDAGLTGTRLPDEAIGPAAVLLAAGARSVTAPLWPLDDQTSGAFMTRYHRLMAAGTDPARALATAQRAAHGEPPLVWSSLVHFGA
ncbi:CHAT domain-containing protein [Frankia sp. CiP3]|uniref:CHAT domain-containing protein n=1 Tax=Frankia sp. CiP3 TaxID=2880971 RepID=UPI0027DF9338|nr:CHAT domain-containing protein [Frankia sp. CiP3]